MSSKAKKLFGSGNMGQNIGGAPFRWISDTRPCKILDPRLVLSGKEAENRCVFSRRRKVVRDEAENTSSSKQMWIRYQNSSFLI